MARTVLWCGFFIELNDGSFFKNVQIVFEAEKLANYDEVTKLGVGAPQNPPSGGKVILSLSNP